MDGLYGVRLCFFVGLGDVLFEKVVVCGCCMRMLVEVRGFVGGDEQPRFVFNLYGVVFEFVEERAVNVFEFSRLYHLEHAVFEFL